MIATSKPQSAPPPPSRPTRLIVDEQQPIAKCVIDRICSVMVAPRISLSLTQHVRPVRLWNEWKLSITPGPARRRYNLRSAKFSGRGASAAQRARSVPFIPAGMTTSLSSRSTARNSARETALLTSSGDQRPVPVRQHIDDHFTDIRRLRRRGSWHCRVLRARWLRLPPLAGSGRQRG